MSNPDDIQEINCISDEEVVDIVEFEEDHPRFSPRDLTDEPFDFPEQPHQDVHRFLRPYHHQPELESKSTHSYCVPLPSPAFIGLPNLGNSCYLNAVIQFFLQAKDLQLVIQYLFWPEEDEEWTVEDLRFTLGIIRKQYTSNAGIGLYDQCDSSLVLGWLLDQCLEKAKLQQNDDFIELVKEQFEVRQQKVWKCCECNHISQQPNSDLCIHLYADSKMSGEPVDLVQLYNEQYNQIVEKKCEKCNHTKAKETVFNRRNPDHLFFVIHALHAKIVIPDELHVPLYEHSPEVYYLRGVIIHRGLTENYGHYSCFTCMDDDESEPHNIWSHYDDTRITRDTDIEDILSGNIDRYTSVKVLWYTK